MSESKMELQVSSLSSGSVLSYAEAFLRDEGCSNVCETLHGNTTVRELDLRGNDIRGTGARSFGALLAKNGFIQKVCLEWNSLGDEVEHLAEGLASNTSLVELDLRNNKIGVVGAKALSVALERNCTLKSLDLRWNNLGPSGGKVLLEGLERNSSVVSCQLAGNRITPDTLRGIESVLDKNKRRAAVASGESAAAKLAQRDQDARQAELEEHQQRMLARLRDMESDSSDRIRQLEARLAEALSTADKERQARMEAEAKSNTEALAHQAYRAQACAAQQALEDQLTQSDTLLRAARERVQIGNGVEAGLRADIDRLQAQLRQETSRANSSDAARGAVAEELTHCKLEHAQQMEAARAHRGKLEETIRELQERLTNQLQLLDDTQRSHDDQMLVMDIG